MEKESKGVAWYDAPGRGWLRDIWVLSHFPYTIWHLSYVPIGAALAPRLDWGVLGWTILAFFLAMGIGGHCLDELNGRPLRTQLPSWGLWLAVVLSIAGAIAIGILIGVRETVWVIPSIVFGGFIVFAYNLELGPKGFFHRDEWFGFAWGAFPVLTAYVAQAHTISPEIVFVAGGCLLYSMVQRVLSLQARFWRRKVLMFEGHYFTDAPTEPNRPRVLTKQDIIKPAELALKLMTWTVVAAAVGLLLIHL
ncbi:hypothetical protein ES703_90179 [subsurface metagenome]